MVEFIYIAAALAKEEEDFDFKGLFSGPQSVVGWILVVVGILTVWLGIKLWNGYRLIMPSKDAEPQEDKYVPGEAKALQKKKELIPTADGTSEREVIHWKIGYTVGEEKYTQIISGDYEKGDVIPIKYDPADPQRFYLVDKTQESPEEETPEEQEEHNSTGIIVALLGVIVGAVGVILIL